MDETQGARFWDHIGVVSGVRPRSPSDPIGGGRLAEPMLDSLPGPRISKLKPRMRR
jgi:hypothetical protein